MTENDPLAGLNGYELTHLIAHLTAAGQMGNVHRLLALERTTPVPDPGRFGRYRSLPSTANAWHEAHESAANATGYLADVALARRHAGNLGLDLRYALIEATVGGRDRNVPPELVAAMVTAGLWTTEQGISRAAYLSWPDRAKAVASLAARLPERDRDVVLASELVAAAAVPDPEARAVSLAVLGPEDFGPVLKAVELVRYDRVRAKVLVEVAGHLPTEFAPRAADMAGRLMDTVGRAEAVAAVVPLLPMHDRLRVTLDLFTSIDSDHPLGVQARDVDHVNALARIAGAYARISEHISERVPGLLEVAWHMAKEASDKKAAAPGAPHPLAGVAPYLEETLRSQIALAEFGDAVRIRNRQRRVSAMIRALPLFAEDERGAAARVIWNDASALRRASSQVHTARALLAYLTEPTRTKAARIALARLPEVSGYQPGVRDALVALAPHLPASLLRQALRAPWRSRDEAERAEALAALLPHLPAAEQRPFVRRIVDVIDSMDHDSLRGAAWSKVLGWPNESFRVELTAAAMQSVLRVRDRRVDALAYLAPHLDRAWVYRQALRVARRTSGVSWRSEAFAAVASLAPPGERDRHLAKALALAHKEKEEPIRCGVLASLAPVAVDSPLLSTLLAEIGRIQGAYQRLFAYNALVPLLDEGRRDEVMADVLIALDGVHEDRGRQEALLAMAGCFPESSMPTVLGVARQIGDVQDRAAVLAALIPYLPDTLLDAALADVRSLALDQRPPVLAEIAPRLSDDLRAEAADSTVAESASRPPVERALLLTPLSPWIANRQDLLDDALRTARTPDAVTDVLLTLAAGNRDALVRLAPRLDEAQFDAVQQAVAGLDVADARVEMVGELAWHRESVELAVIERGFRLVLAERSTRAELVAAIARLADVIHRLGGESAALEVARAIVDIGRWWR